MFKKFLLMCVCALGLAYRDSADGFDFEFREMELYRAAESIAKLKNRYVIFDAKVANKLVNLSVTDVSPEFALKLLLESNGAYSVERGGIYYVYQGGDRQPAALMPTIIPLTNVIAKDIENNVAGYMPKEARYTINEQKNAFVITGSEEDVEKVRKLIQDLDQEVSQIFIEARIIETDVTFSRNLGIEWGSRDVRNANPGGGAPPPGSGSQLREPGVSISGLTSGANNLLGSLRVGVANGGKLDALLIAGEKNGNLKIISSPKITALNGTPANITSNTTLVIRTLQSSTIGQNTPTITGQQLQQQNTSELNFKVTPFIVSDDQVRLNIDLTKADPLEITDPTNTVANMRRNSMSTNLLVRNGQTASLGGLFTQRSEKSQTGAPFLSHIPILGLLFGSDNRDKQDRELLIFMTPTIYKGSRGNIYRRRPHSDDDAVSGALENLRKPVPLESAGVLAPPVPAPSTVAPTDGKTEPPPAAAAQGEKPPLMP